MISDFKQLEYPSVNLCEPYVWADNLERRHHGRNFDVLDVSTRRGVSLSIGHRCRLA